MKQNTCITFCSDKIKVKHFLSVKALIDDLRARNDGKNFGMSFRDIYPKDFELKSGWSCTVLNLNVTIMEGTFIWGLFDKRTSFYFSIFIVRMHLIKSNISQNIFYSVINSDFVRTACSTLLLRDFLPKAKELLKLMKKRFQT